MPPARAAEQVAKAEKLEAEKRALEAEKRALEAQREVSSAKQDVAVAVEARRQAAPAGPTRLEEAPPKGNEPRAGRVTIGVSVQFDASKANGTAWDVGPGGQPDPLLAARVGSNGATFNYNAADNNGSASTTWDADLAASDSITITAYDEDLAANDLGGNFTVQFDGRAGTKSGKSGAVAFTVTFSAPR